MKHTTYWNSITRENTVSVGKMMSGLCVEGQTATFSGYIRITFVSPLLSLSRKDCPIFDSHSSSSSRAEKGDTGLAGVFCKPKPSHWRNLCPCLFPDDPVSIVPAAPGAGPFITTLQSVIQAISFPLSIQTEWSSSASPHVPETETRPSTPLKEVRETCVWDEGQLIPSKCGHGCSLSVCGHAFSLCFLCSESPLPRSQVRRYN